MSPARAHELSPLEIASGLVFGRTPQRALSVAEDPERDPVRALERAILPALQRPPCLVSFSGGRDSSAVLALATRLARREGLPLPIPSTNRFPAVADSDESEWQERIVSHLGIDEWSLLEFSDELDCVGPVAAQVLRRHGVLWPFNAHFHVPQFEATAGGSVLTGIGGDETLSPSRWARPRTVLNREARPERRDLLRFGFLVTPPPLRRAVLRRRIPLEYRWLRPAARRSVAAAWAADAASEPLGWQAQLRWRRRIRYLEVGTGSLDVLAADNGVQVVHPLLDGAFATALAHLPKKRRYSDRTAAMRLLFGDVLPDDLLARTTKSGFDEAFWNEPSRTFAAHWDGDGVDETVVDVEALRREWSRAVPDPRSYLLLQAVWVASQTETTLTKESGATLAGWPVS